MLIWYRDGYHGPDTLHSLAPNVRSAAHLLTHHPVGKVLALGLQHIAGGRPRAGRRVTFA